MRVQIAPKLVKKIKKQDVRIRKNFKIAISLFSEDSDNSQLNNHPLTREWEGYRSIDVTSNWRAVYQEVGEDDETAAYFIELGTHEQLFKKHKQLSDS